MDSNKENKMQENTLTQKQFDRLDKISKDCGHELFMPPSNISKLAHHPFFVLKENDEMDGLIKKLARSRFNYSLTRVDNKKHILIKG